jgi:phosphoesterase RecJ-like protein
VSKEIAEAVGRVGNFVLATHIRPDGDALGSLLALAYILEGMGKQVLCYLEEPLPEMYGFLPCTCRVETDFEQVDAFVRSCDENVMGICLDCGDLQRLGRNGSALTGIRPFAVIDHHQGNSGFGDLAWIEPHRSSTGEMVFDLARTLGAVVSRDAAACLYTAIVTDTGSFQYDNASSHTFTVAGRLVELGAEPARIARNLYDNASFGRIRLLQMVLATLEAHVDDQVAVIRVTRDMLRATGTRLEDTEGFINHPRSVRGVKVAVFLKESSDQDPLVSVSLRAKGECDVQAVAARFGGGGHRNASGFKVGGRSIDQVRDQLLPVLEQALAG